MNENLKHILKRTNPKYLKAQPFIDTFTKKYLADEADSAQFNLVNKLGEHKFKGPVSLPNENGLSWEVTVIKGDKTFEVKGDDIKEVLEKLRQQLN